MFQVCNIDKHADLLLTYFNIEKYDNSIIYNIDGGLIGLINDNVMILNLDLKHRTYKIFNHIFNKFVKTLKIDVLYASSNNSELLYSVGFVQLKNKLAYYVKLHNVLKLEYPYTKYFLKLDDIKNCLSAVKNYSMKTKKSKNLYPDIELIWEKERYINKITDYFTDYCRSRCVFKNKISPYDHYINNKGNIVLQSLTNGKFDIDKFENVLYNNDNIKFCNNFQVTLAASIYKMFNGKRIFDSSCGWGDRLIAAIALNMEYCGTDPSQCLKPLYNNIIETLGNKNIHKIYNIGIEELDTTLVGKFDLCFSSPPFYDLEIYDDNNVKQSTSSYKTMTDWENGFLIPLAEQNIAVLENNGHLVMFVPGYYKVIEYLSKHPLLKSKGHFNYLTPQKRKIFVWQKVQNN